MWPERHHGFVQVQRVYLIEVTDTESFCMNLDTVVMLDRKTRKLTRCSVEHAPGVTDDSDNVLRVTCGAPFPAPSCAGTVQLATGVCRGYLVQAGASSPTAC